MTLTTFERLVPWSGGVAGLCWIGQATLQKTSPEDMPGAATTQVIHDQPGLDHAPEGTQITRLTDDETGGQRREWSLVGHGIDWTRPGPSNDGAHSSTPQILFPCNGSPTAEAALDVAADWAHALRANAWVLYVRPWDTSRGGHYFVETRAEAHAVAAEAVVRLRARGVSASGVIRSADRGRIAHAILAEADALNVRMIVLGTRARGVIGTALLGSTSRSVARRAARPVVLVKAGAPSAFVTRRQPLDT